MKKRKAKRQNKPRKEKRELLNYNIAIKIIIIIALLTILKFIITSDKSPLTFPTTKANLEGEALEVLQTITNENMPINVLDSNEIVEEKIERLEQMDYEEIKSLTGIRNDFCIFFEDVIGDLVRINEVKSGIGSRKIYINGRPCE